MDPNCHTESEPISDYILEVPALADSLLENTLHMMCSCHFGLFPIEQVIVGQIRIIRGEVETGSHLCRKVVQLQHI